MTAVPDRTHSTETLTLLHADDLESWHWRVRQILQVRPDWKLVATCCDGEEAVQKAIQLRPNVVILDIGMPGLNGIEAARLIRQKSPLSRIIFLTQQGDPDFREAALTIPGTRFVLKGNAATELVPAIAGAIADKNRPPI